MAQQIKKKFIQNDAVDGQKIKLQKDQSIRGQKQDGSEVELLKLDGSDKLVSGGQELAFKQVVDAQVSDVQGKLDSEQASRISGDSTEQSRAQGEESRIESKFDSMIASEESSRGSADQGLQSQINTEKGRIDAILSASDADKDSFAEIVELINSVDTESDSAFASYVLSNNTALASEVSSRQQGDQGLQSNIDAEETRAMGEESRIESKFDGTMSTEQAARIAGDADLQSQHDDLDGYAQDVRSDLDNLDGYAQDVRSDLDQEIVDRAAAVSAEASARQSADSSLQSSLNSEISRAQSAESTEQAARIAGDSSTLQSSKDYTDGKISLLMSNLDTEALDSLVEVVTAFQNADSSLNSTISSLSSSASSGLATEQAARIAGDQTLQLDLDAAEAAISSEIMRATGVEGGIDSRLVTAENEINTLQFDLDAAEAAISSEVMRATGVEGGLDSRIQALEVQNDGPYFQKQKFVIDEISELSSIELSHECMENSLVVCVGRLMVHKDEDYSVSVVSGKSVLTWMGDFATSGVEGIEAGDVIFVTFAREV